MDCLSGCCTCALVGCNGASASRSQDCFHLHQSRHSHAHSSGWLETLQGSFCSPSIHLENHFWNAKHKIRWEVVGCCWRKELIYYSTKVKCECEHRKDKIARIYLLFTCACTSALYPDRIAILHTSWLDVAVVDSDIMMQLCAIRLPATVLDLSTATRVLSVSSSPGEGEMRKWMMKAPKYYIQSAPELPE